MWKQGGAAPWNGVTYDPKTNLIYVQLEILHMGIHTKKR